MLDLKPNELNILSKKDKVINKYMEEVERINEDPEFYEYISAEEDNRKIENSLKSQYKREGLEEGIEQGTRLAKLEAAKNFKENGVDIEIIAKSTGLTIEEISEL
jgi:predicted transposase/invertase (TIGR01784 family)